VRTETDIKVVRLGISSSVARRTVSGSFDGEDDMIGFLSRVRAPGDLQNSRESDFQNEPLSIRPSRVELRNCDSGIRGP